MAGVNNIFDCMKVLDKNGGEVDLAKHCAGKTVGIYFSAHWCPPCQKFTPILAKFYRENHEAKNFEIIFVSSDRDEDSFREYYEEMPWLSLLYCDMGGKQRLGSKYGIRGLPSLVIVNGDSGAVLTTDGRIYVSKQEWV